jgi:hypothetical protein
MTAKYRIEIELSVEEGSATRAMELARDVYLQRGGARTVENGVEREMSADEFIEDMGDALLELVEGSLLRLPGIAIGHENCRQVLPEVETAPYDRTGEDRG